VLLNPEGQADYGCFISHILLLQHIVADQSLEWAVVFEDNIDFLSEIPRELDIPKDAELVTLDGYHEALPYNLIFGRTSGGRSALGYLIKRSSIEALLENLK